MLQGHMKNLSNRWLIIEAHLVYHKKNLQIESGVLHHSLVRCAWLRDPDQLQKNLGKNPPLVKHVVLIPIYLWLY